MKEATNEMEGEAEKWNADENNDIVKRAKNMSAMALSMYQFTKGEGNLRTTQDLFTQAEYFAEEANRLYKVVRQFSYQVKYHQIYNSPHCHDLSLSPYSLTIIWWRRDVMAWKTATLSQPKQDQQSSNYLYCVLLVFT